MRLRRLELNGGQVKENPYWRLTLPPTAKGLCRCPDRRLWSCGLPSPRHYRGVRAHACICCARFSHRTACCGTAGFGFWNSPFADPSVRCPLCPRRPGFSSLRRLLICHWPPLVQAAAGLPRHWMPQRLRAGHDSPGRRRSCCSTSLAAAAQNLARHPAAVEDQLCAP